MKFRIISTGPKDTRELFYEFDPTRKPRSLDDIDSCINWSYLNSAQKNALASKPNIELDDNLYKDVLPDFGNDDPNCINLEYVDASGWEDNKGPFLVYINTEGTQYARYGLIIRMTGNNWVEYHSLQEQAENRLPRKIQEVNLREKKEGKMKLKILARPKAIGLAELEKEISLYTEQSLKKIQAILKSRGYSYKRKLQSAQYIMSFDKDGNKGFEINGWHGTGEGNRWFGDLRTIHSVFEWADGKRWPPKNHLEIDVHTLDRENPDQLRSWFQKYKLSVIRMIALIEDNA